MHLLVLRKKDLEIQRSSCFYIHFRIIQGLSIDKKVLISLIAFKLPVGSFSETYFFFGKILAPEVIQAVVLVGYFNVELVVIPTETGLKKKTKKTGTF